MEQLLSICYLTNVKYHYTEYRRCEKSPATCLTIQCTPNLDNVFWCSKHNNGHHTNHIKVKFEMLCVWYYLCVYIYIYTHTQINYHKTTQLELFEWGKTKSDSAQKKTCLNNATPVENTRVSNPTTKLSSVRYSGQAECFSNTVLPASGNLTFLLLLFSLTIFTTTPSFTLVGILDFYCFFF